MKPPHAPASLLLLIGASALLLILHPVSIAADDREGPPDTLVSGEDSIAKVTNKEDKVGPISVFADIEGAWQDEKVGDILRHYGKNKVTISIEGTGPAGGSFSKNQSHYLLKDLFDYTITERFEFVQYRNVKDGRSRVYAVAEREYKRNDDGRKFEDKIYVSLHLENDRWVISEIKSIQ
jgi:hypothetical protein